MRLPLPGGFAPLALVLVVVACAGGQDRTASAAPAPAGPGTGSARAEPERLRVRVVSSHPHDPTSYTQGLFYTDGRLVESRGQFGSSGLFEYEIGGGTRRTLALPGDLFGEGTTLVGDRVIQLTWKSGRVFVYDAESWEVVDEWRLAGEGWGLAYDGQDLWVSNGTHVLSVRSTEDFRELRRVQVKRGRVPQDRLNELEWVDGQLYANVYQTDELVRIDPDGQVTAIIDASGLLQPDEAVRAEVLNGIAHVPEENQFVLTGKYWPSLFVVEFVPR